jgi:hypothetical protein
MENGKWEMENIPVLFAYSLRVIGGGGQNGVVARHSLGDVVPQPFAPEGSQQGSKSTKKFLTYCAVCAPSWLILL